MGDEDVDDLKVTNNLQHTQKCKYGVKKKSTQSLLEINQEQSLTHRASFKGFNHQKTWEKKFGGKTIGSKLLQINKL